MALTSIIAMMISRKKKDILIERLRQFPAVALLGSRQVGKTTLAKQIGSQVPFDRETLYLDLESASDRAKLSDVELYLSAHEDKLVILDEVQRLPDLFQTLRGLIDKGRSRNIRSGRFLLLGSASMNLLKQSSESLAGRIAYVELNPLLVEEINDEQFD